MTEEVAQRSPEVFFPTVDDFTEGLKDTVV